MSPRLAPTPTESEIHLVKGYLYRPSTFSLLSGPFHKTAPSTIESASSLNANHIISPSTRFTLRKLSNLVQNYLI